MFAGKIAVGRVFSMPSSTLLARCYVGHIVVKVDSIPLVFGIRKHFGYNFQHAKTLGINNELHAIQTTDAEPLEKLTQLDSFCFMPSAAPGITRYPSLLTANAIKMSVFLNDLSQLRRG